MPAVHTRTFDRSRARRPRLRARARLRPRRLRPRLRLRPARPRLRPVRSARSRSAQPARRRRRRRQTRPVTSTMIPFTWLRMHATDGPTGLQPPVCSRFAAFLYGIPALCLRTSARPMPVVTFHGFIELLDVLRVPTYARRSLLTFGNAHACERCVSRHSSVSVCMCKRVCE
eukprot:4605224-Pleurochrysis_carterae.AAC.3